MDLFEAIRARHSYRGEFLGESIGRDKLEKIVTAGLVAPSGCNAQSTEFVVVDEQELLAKVGEILDKPAVKTAAAVILCLVNKEAVAVYNGMSFEVEDCAAAVENMLLAVAAEGYASVWIDGALRVESRAERIGEVVGVPTGKIVRVLLPVGRPAEKSGQPVKKGFGERAYYNRYGG